MYVSFFYVLFFFFKQKTAYEMRISDWSSDVCSSDLQRLCCPLPFAHPWPPLLGSSTSRRPSPSRLNPRLTMKMAMPGTVATHHWLISTLRPLEIMAPHSGSGGCAPRPRKPRPDRKSTRLNSSH